MPADERILPVGLAYEKGRQQRLRIVHEMRYARAKGGPELQKRAWELRKQLSWIDGVAGIGHWRTSDGDEADLVIELDNGDVVAFEISAGSSVPGEKFRGLKQLRSSLGDSFRGGAVLYLGRRSYSYDDRLHALPLDRLWTPA